MNAMATISNKEDLDSLMLQLARTFAMGLYEIDDILEQFECSRELFEKLKEHPRFVSYLKSEREAWNAASNTAERTRLKSAIVLEQYMLQAHSDMHDKKIALNHRVELGKLLGRLSGAIDGKTNIVPGTGGGFNLQINIAPGRAPVVINPKVIDQHSDEFDTGEL